MPVHVMVRAETGGYKPPPFAAIPHDIAADPRLTPVDVRVIAALLYWARDKASAWPCDRSIAARVGRSVSTVQRALRRLQALGLVQREKVPQSDANRTGRILRLRWRLDRGVGHPCQAPRSLPTAEPRSWVTDEGEIKRERERPESGPGPESPSPTAEELELWRGWAEGSNATLARIGRAALATAGGESRGGEAPSPPLPSGVGGAEEIRPEGTKSPEPAASQVREPTGPCAPRPEGPQTPGIAESQAQRPPSPPTFRTTVSGAPRPIGARSPGSMSPKARDADDLAIPWAFVLSGLGDRRSGGSRHPRPQGP